MVACESGCGSTVPQWCRVSSSHSNCHAQAGAGCPTTPTQGCCKIEQRTSAQQSHSCSARCFCTLRHSLTYTPFRSTERNQKKENKRAEYSSRQTKQQQNKQQHHTHCCNPLFPSCRYFPPVFPTFALAETSSPTAETFKPAAARLQIEFLRQTSLCAVRFGGTHPTVPNSSRPSKAHQTI